MSPRVGRMETPSSKALKAERLGRSLTAGGIVKQTVIWEFLKS